MKKRSLGDAKPRRCCIDRLEWNLSRDFYIGLHSEKPSGRLWEILELPFRELWHSGHEQIKNQARGQFGRLSLSQAEERFWDGTPEKAVRQMVSGLYRERHRDIMPWRRAPTP